MLAAQCGRADIVRWYMRQYPEGIRLVVYAYELSNDAKLMECIRQLLTIDNLYLTNIASAVSRMSEHYDDNTPKDIINEHINFARGLVECTDDKINQNDINCLGIVMYVLRLQRDKSRPSADYDKKMNYVFCTYTECSIHKKGIILHHHYFPGRSGHDTRDISPRANMSSPGSN